MKTIKNFDLIKCKNNIYRYVIFAKSGINPLSELIEIEKELSSSAIKGEVLFDLLRSNGESSNRYISAFYDGKHFSPGTFKIAKSLPPEFKVIASKYYSRNKTT